MKDNELFYDIKLQIIYMHLYLFDESLFELLFFLKIIIIYKNQIIKANFIAALNKLN